MLSAVSEGLTHILDLLKIFISSLNGTSGVDYNNVYFRYLLIVIPVAFAILFLALKLIKRVTWGR